MGPRPRIRHGRWAALAGPAAPALAAIAGVLLMASRTNRAQAAPPAPEATEKVDVADPDRIATMGSSAGGHLAALAAVTQAKDGFEPTDDGLGDVSSAVQACVTYYGPHDWSMWGGKRGKDTPEDIEKGRQASTITHLDKDDPPTLVFHGNKDITVRYAQSQILAAKLKEVGVPHEFITIEGKGHGTFYEPRKSGLNDHALVTWFLGKHLEGKDEPKPDAAVGSPPRPAP